MTIDQNQRKNELNGWIKVSGNVILTILTV